MEKRFRGTIVAAKIKYFTRELESSDKEVKESDLTDLLEYKKIMDSINKLDPDLKANPNKVQDAESMALYGKFLRKFEPKYESYGNLLQRVKDFEKDNTVYFTLSFANKTVFMSVYEEKALGKK